MVRDPAWSVAVARQVVMPVRYSNFSWYRHGRRLRGAGYAGWDAGQLAGELNRGDWLVAPALPSDVLAAPAFDLWGSVLRRQGMPAALLATHPGELQRN